MKSGDGTREREVRAQDPGLSPQANELLTGELREAVGSDKVQVPADRADQVGRLEGTSRTTLRATLASNRAVIGLTFAILVVVGAIIALATENWWAVVAAAGVHATCTLLVATLALRLSTEVEHMDPAVAARLEEEGVPDPDRVLSDLVEQYSDTDHARGAAEVVSSGNNEITTEPGDDQARATAEQRSAITPAGSPVGPAEEGAPAVLPIVAVAGSFLVALGVAIAMGGVAWVLPAVIGAAGAVWLLLEHRMRGGQERTAGGRDVGDAQAGRRGRLIPTAVVVVGAVVSGVILVGLVAGYL